MADRRSERVPRWTNTGYWTDREEESGREGDRGMSRNDNREDMRRYGRQSVDQGDRLRRLRGQQNKEYRNRGWGGSIDRWGTSNSPDADRWEGQDTGRGYRHEGGRNFESGRGGYREGYPPERYRGTGQDNYTDDDPVNNYWGREERRRLNRQTEYEPGYTSARGYGLEGIQMEEEEREYDMDPGFSYEFGTDFDFRGGPGRDEFRGRNPRQADQQQGGFRGQQARPANRAGASQGEFWDVPGPYRGMGPSSYQRSDERILDEVNERLARHGRVDSRRIEVQVQNGEVTLRGEVNEKNAKRIAEDLAASISGVSDVNNQIRVTK